LFGPLADPTPQPHTVDTLTDPLALLLAESRRWPLLTPAEEIELSKRVERGDLQAKERMINSNLRLVVHVARKYQGQGLPIGDLVQEGTLGLIRAVEKFDWRKGFRFSTYGTLWIRQAIQRGLENTSRTVRLPVHMSQRARKVSRVTRELTVKLGHEPTNEELADVLELTVEEIEEVKTADQATTSLDRPVGEDGDTTFGELMPADQLSTEDEVVDSWQFETLESAVAELPPEERTVIELRFGRNREGKVHTLHQAGRVLGVSAQRTRELEDSALRRLAKNGELEALRDAA
jgi:RNA polymerase primary sigma factor